VVRAEGECRNDGRCGRKSVCALVNHSSGDMPVHPSGAQEDTLYWSELHAGIKSSLAAKAVGGKSNVTFLSVELNCTPPSSLHKTPSSSR